MKMKGERVKRKDRVPDKSKRRVAAVYVVIQALVAWGDSSTEYDVLEHPKDTSMLVVEQDDTIYNSLFVLMSKSGDDEDDEVPFLKLSKTSMTIFV